VSTDASPVDWVSTKFFSKIASIIPNISPTDVENVNVFHVISYDYSNSSEDYIAKTVNGKGEQLMPRFYSSKNYQFVNNQLIQGEDEKPAFL
jgi:hypothetical protein